MLWPGLLNPLMADALGTILRMVNLVNRIKKLSVIYHSLDMLKGPNELFWDNTMCIYVILLHRFTKKYFLVALDVFGKFYVFKGPYYKYVHEIV